LQTIKHNNIDRWYQFLTTSKYNKRLYNNKRKRLEKFSNIYTDLTQNRSILDYATDMSLLRHHLSAGMKQERHNKTMSFAIKMYGYVVRIVDNTFVPYPMDVVIPLDSRLYTIYEKQFPNNKDSDKTIIQYYQKIAETIGIPPLHLDAAIRIDYREKYS
jgi:N-glycosylase/DNA lyase